MAESKTVAPRGVFASVPAYAGDPILSLQQAYAGDARADRVNLSIGLYYDEAGRVPVLGSVRAARAALQSRAPVPGYLPMGGDEAYCRLAQELIFGAGNPAILDGRIATVQTLGGSGALKVGADFLHDLYPRSGVWVSAPTWDNHRAIFEGAGFDVNTYPYLGPAGTGVAFDEMLAAFWALPPASIVVLHPCCHNPTGLDLTPAQWDELIYVAGLRGLIPFLDMAYQGYGKGIDEDCYAIREMARAGLSFLVSHSFSKIFSMYADRCGSLSVVGDSMHEASRIHGRLQFAIRRNYSSPPASGAAIIVRVLSDGELRNAWMLEVRAMRKRIRRMRADLYAAATEGSEHDWGFLLEQRGLFSFEPRLGAAATALRTKFGIYILASGRVCMAGLTAASVGRVGRAFASVLADTR